MTYHKVPQEPHHPPGHGTPHPAPPPRGHPSPPPPHPGPGPYQGYFDHGHAAHPPPPPPSHHHHDDHHSGSGCTSFLQGWQCPIRKGRGNDAPSALHAKVNAI